MKANLVANYVAQIYVAFVGIVTLPIYFGYMGAEAYGLVSFFALLQAWFLLLDVGLTPTIGRETARFRGGAVDALTYRRLVRVLESIFVAVGVVGGGLLIIAAGSIAGGWLQVEKLPLADVVFALQLIGVIVGLRWMTGLYRSIINGAERLVWLSAYGSGIASLRFLGILPILIYVDASPATFFWYQLVVAVLELIGLFLYAQRLLPLAGGSIGWHWRSLGTVLPFSLVIAFTSAVWIVVTQTDKVVLSRILPLADYGYFSLGVLLASGILIISGPVSNVIMPAMSRLEAEGKTAELIHLYRRATQFVAIIACSISIAFAVWAEPLLWVWTGDRAVALQVAPILRSYALGNGILALAGFPYYLQYAKGNLRLHLIGNAIFVVVLTPLIVWAASAYGAAGAGWVWLGMNALAFVAWLPLVHRRFAPGLNMKWYFEDILPIAAAAGAVAVLAEVVLPSSDDRIIQAALIVVGSVASILAGAAGSSETRSRVLHMLRRTQQ